VEWQLYLAIGFFVLAPMGLVCGGLALYHYLRFEGSADIARVPVAMTVFAVQYVLFLTLASSLRYHLLLTRRPRCCDPRGPTPTASEVLGSSREPDWFFP
jgi:hypothetical protein